MTTCVHIKDDGTRCRNDAGLDDAGLCPVHREGGREYMSKIGALGGHAAQRKLASQGFTLDELIELKTHEDAKRSLEQIRNAVMTRRITHAEGNAASKAVAEWVKADQASIAKSLVNELRAELDAKEKQIDELRRQLQRSQLRRA